MLVTLHHEQDATKLLEVLSFPGSQTVRQEERDDPLPEVFELSHSVRHPVAMVLSNHPTAKEALQAVKHLHVSFMLDDGELRKHLNSGCHFGMLGYSDMKAALAIHEAGNPSGF